MERWDYGPDQPIPGTEIDGWNILELESRRHLRNRIHEFIDLINYSTLSTSELQRLLQHSREQFGSQFSTHLLYALQRTHEAIEREAIVWLLVQLNDPATIPFLERLVQHRQQPRATRLSAALALAGMGVSPHLNATHQPRLYALS